MNKYCLIIGWQYVVPTSPETDGRIPIWGPEVYATNMRHAHMIAKFTEMEIVDVFEHIGTIDGSCMDSDRPRYFDPKLN